MNAAGAFAEMHLPTAPVTTAPDGSGVRVLLALNGGSMAHFELAAGRVSAAVRHRTVEEIWFVIDGSGEMWRRDDVGRGRAETVVALASGVCLTIPVGTSFQFRSTGPGPLQAVAVTMPPWPGDREAELVYGCPDW